MPRKHSLKISLRSYTAPFTYIILRYRGEKKYERVIHKNFDTKHWDNNRNNIKQSHQSLYGDLPNLISRYQSQFPLVIQKLNEGLIAPENAIDVVIGTLEKVQSKTIKEFILEYGYKSEGKYLQNLSGIHKNLREANYKIKELKLVHLSDISIVKDIIKIFDESKSLGNTRIDYMKNLDRYSRDAHLPIESPFKKVYGRYPKKIEAYKPKVENDKMLMGIGNINTYKQLEAYLFWLYSYCLQGIDGGDIVNLDEGCLDLEPLKGKKLTHYHILGDYVKPDDTEYDFSKRVSYFKPRNKSQKTAKGVYNQFPTLFIRDWLHYLIKLNRPSDAYMGSDRIRLFNFKTRGENNQVIEENMKRWRIIGGTYSDQLKKIIGATIIYTRHTNGQLGIENGFSGDDVDRMLGHSEKGVNRHYLSGAKASPLMAAKQAKMIESFGVENNLKMLLKSLSRRKLKSLDKHVNPITDLPFKTYNSNLAYGNALLGFKTNMINWSVDDEALYQKAQSELNGKRIDIGDDGLPIERSVDIGELIPEYQEIIERRRESLKVNANIGISFNNGKLRIYSKDTKKEYVKIEDNVLKHLQLNQKLYDGKITEDEWKKQKAKIPIETENDGVIHLKRIAN